MSVIIRLNKAMDEGTFVEEFFAALGGLSSEQQTALYEYYLMHWCDEETLPEIQQVLSTSGAIGEIETILTK
jgi:hypothetical protein